jgi:hypothetical protein
MTDPNLKVLIPSDKIQARIRELGAQISADYPNGSLYFICILKGACFFLTDLARAMRRDVSVDFMGISTYGKGKTSSGEVRVTKDLDISLEGADVVIVEDIVDSGVTLNYLGPSRFASPPCWINPSAACVPCMPAMWASRSRINLWWDTAWTTRRNTAIWTTSAYWKSRPSCPR